MLVTRGVIREIAEGLYFYVDGISFRCEKHPPFFPYRTRGNSLHQNRQEWKLPLLLCPLFLAVHGSMQKHVNFSFGNLSRLY